MDEPAPKRARVAQKTADERLVEQNARVQSQRLPGVGRNATFEDHLKWMKEHYTMQSLADDGQQLPHWSAQSWRPSQRTFLHQDRTPTPTYNRLQSGNTRATPLSEYEKQLAEITRAQKVRITISNRDLGQMNWLEGAGLAGFMNFIGTLGYTLVRFERMPDCVTVDFCAKFGSYTAPVQVKVARGPPGTQVAFSVNKADGAAGGRYEDHVLICLVVNAEDDNSKKFDELPTVDILEAYIMKSSDIKSIFNPMVYDHTPGSKRGRKNSYEEFRYVVGRDSPAKVYKLMRSLESNIKVIWEKRKWTRDDCFFKFGEGSPNTEVSTTQETEMRGMQAVSEALIPFEPRAALRQNETVDILFWNRLNSEGILSSDLSALSVRVSLKTASYNHLNKDTGEYSGFYFPLNNAPNSDHCDIVIAVRFDLPGRKKAIAVYVFDAKDVYSTGIKTFHWNKSSHADKMFDMTSQTGRDAFKERVHSFMLSDEQRASKDKTS